jgi:hypothetical protein
MLAPRTRNILVLLLSAIAAFYVFPENEKVRWIKPTPAAAETAYVLGRRLTDVSFQDVPASDIIAELSRRTSVPIVIDPAAAPYIDIDQLVSFRLDGQPGRKSIAAICGQLRKRPLISYAVVDDGTCVIGRRYDPRLAQVRVYDLAGIVREWENQKSREEFSSLIHEVVDADSWATVGELGRCHFLPDNLLLVVQRSDEHRELQTLIDHLEIMMGPEYAPHERLFRPESAHARRTPP